MRVSVTECPPSPRGCACAVRTTCARAHTVRTVRTILTLFVVLPNSPNYVRNPYLRIKFVDVLFQLLPDESPSFALSTLRYPFVWVKGY